MRKMKKINGYLVVKFNARELREYEGTALGEYGVIDAELYTGILDVDRGAMEYDNAGSMEEAVELARGLESELDAEEPEVKVTIVKETDETTEEEEVDAQQMIAGWENVLRGQVASAHYPHAKSPAVVYATVSKATQLGETFDLEDLVIHNDETGSSFKGHITAHWNEYTLTVVDRWGNEDESFPPLPGVRSKGQYKAGAFVAVAMAYGDSPAIIGEVQL